MKPSQLLTLLSASAAHAATQQQDDDWFAPPRQLLVNPEGSTKIPTSNESAVMGRRILALTPLATFSTVFPRGASSPESVALSGAPIGLSDYVADCEDEGNPTILSLRIGTTFRNVAHGSNITVSLAWAPPYPPSRRIRSSSSSSSFLPQTRLRSSGGGRWGRHGKAAEEEDGEEERRVDPMPYSGANLPRFALMGHLERIQGAEKLAAVTKCYVAAHPDAKYWLPGNPIHDSEWVRLVVDGVYWIGGFGDRAYIGWIPLDEWKGVTREEWEAIRLPGEKPGWKEWSVLEEEAGAGAAGYFKDL